MPRETRSQSKLAIENKTSVSPSSDHKDELAVMNETMIPKPIKGKSVKSSAKSGSKRSSKNNTKELRLQHLKEEEELLDKKMALMKLRHELAVEMEEEEEGDEDDEEEKASISQTSRVEKWVNNLPRSDKSIENAQVIANRPIIVRQNASCDLPKFSGSPTEWPVFISTYNRTTQLYGLSNDENLIRLERCLIDKARDSVASLLIHPKNVAVIIESLTMKYGQPERIIHDLTKQISSISAVSEGRFDDLVDFALTVQNYCATVEACELDGYLYNEMLLHNLCQKLPPSLSLRWAEFKLSQNDVTLQTFNKWLHSIAKAASTAVQLEPSTSRQQKGKFMNMHSSDSDATEQSASLTAAKQCPVCKETCSSLFKCKRFQDLSYDARWATVKEFKFCKFCLSKHYAPCRRRKECGVNGCSYFHHQLLHNPSINTSGTTTTHNNSVTENSLNLHNTESSDVLFRIVPITLHGEEKSIETYAFLDDGSELSLIDEGLARELGLEGPEKMLCLKWTNDIRRFESASMSVNVKITGTKGSFMMSNVRTVKDLKLPSQTLNMDELKEKYRHLDNIPVESYKNAVPRVLIGLDNSKLGAIQKCREGGQSQPIAGKTRLGWMVYGCCNRNNTFTSFLTHHSLHITKCQCNCDEDLHRNMKDYFSLDSMGVDVSCKTPISEEDRRALELLEKQTSFVGQRYECGLLWKYEHVRLPDNKAMAMRRWKCLELRMQKDEVLANVMEEKIREYKNKHYIRQLTTAELSNKHNRVWYLPIFPVVNENKPGKIRIVWDAAAKVHGISLNSALLKGPDQVSSLVSILYKFREFKVGICGDIREMFHRILIREDDQHSQRFLWKPASQTGPPDEYVMRVMTFGASCSPSTAQYIMNFNARRFRDQYPTATDVVHNHHYVDDLLVSVEHEDEAVKIAKEVKFIHGQGGFEIRNWLSNSKFVLSNLCAEKDEEKNLNIGPTPAAEKVLGMFWCTLTDSFTFKLSPRHEPELLRGQRAPTKREVLRTLMMIYDPLGLISHVLMYLKILLQDIWRSGIEWDEQLKGILLDKWFNWLTVLPLLEEIQIRRCYRKETSTDCTNSIQLHTFVDASENGFAAAVYLRYEEHDVVECSLVGAKTRVAPLTYLSIPRAELQAAILGVRLSISIEESLSIKVSQRYFWTDSRDVLCWIHSDHRRFTPYVASRIGEILEKTEIAQWRWVPSKQNVADDGTKWESKPDVTSTSRWFNGPQFLYHSEEEWPASIHNNLQTKEELRPNILLHCRKQEPIVEYERFSRWTTLYRTIAYILRAKSNMLNLRLNGTCNTIRSQAPLDKSEILVAQNWLYCKVQEEVFSDEIASLKAKKQLQRSSSIFRLAPELDENGVMRIRGRIDVYRYTDLHVQNAVILPADHHVTKLIIRFFHHNLLHRNHETAINQIRLRYLIPGLRKAYRKMRGNCQRCKNESATPLPPMMGELPAARLAAFTRPFAYVGVDYFGPITISIGRRTEKRWGVIVTCLTTRAIHLELAYSLSTDSCIIALRSFMARRGAPAEIYSDNGTNFRGASKELQEAMKSLDQNKLIQEIESPHTTWKFIPPASPHMGGAWERLVRSVKENLSGKRLPKIPTEEILRSALVEIEYSLNSRPLTHLPLDDVSAGVLTPNHFLLGSSNGLKPLAVMDDSVAVVKKGWELSQIMANVFWRHWLTAYLPTITRRTKWFHPVKSIEPGDIVIIVDPQSPRNSWPKGKVIAVKKSLDGQVRKATVQTAQGIYERPAVKLAVLDVDERHRSE